MAFLPCSAAAAAVEASSSRRRQLPASSATSAAAAAPVLRPARRTAAAAAANLQGASHTPVGRRDFFAGTAAAAGRTFAVRASPAAAPAAPPAGQASAEWFEPTPSSTSSRSEEEQAISNAKQGAVNNFREYGRKGVSQPQCQCPICQRPRVFRGEKQRVVILGTGWGARPGPRPGPLPHASATPDRPPAAASFVFTPLLPATAVGSVEFRSIVEPIHKAQPHATYYEAVCTSVDPVRKLVRCRPTARDALGSETEGDAEFEVEYDRLVVSIGARTNTFGIPGVQQNCIFLKEIPGPPPAPAPRPPLRPPASVRQQLLRSWERAILPTVSLEEKARLVTAVVVGGGPTGVEMAGELQDFYEHDLKRQFPALADLAKVVMLQADSELLPQFEKKLRGVAFERYRKLGVDVRLNTAVKRVDVHELSYETKDPATGAVQAGTLPFGTCIWGAGVAPNPLVEAFRASANTFACQLDPEVEGEAQGRRGFLEVDDNLRVIGLGHDVFAIGDCASVRSGALLQTGQVAAQEGQYLARNFNRISKGAEEAEVWKKPFWFMNLGQLTSLGENYALAMLPVGYLYGYPSWILWRSVYIAKQVSWRNRLQVIQDFVRTWMFGRDISELGIEDQRSE
eukprot:tig00021017_g17204.t1